MQYKSFVHIQKRNTNPLNFNLIGISSLCVWQKIHFTKVSQVIILTTDATD